MSEFIGSRISLISRSDIRYVGILHDINSEKHTVALEQVVSHGTEGRLGDPAKEIAGSDNVYEYIVFRGGDVKDLRIEEAAQKPKPQQQVPDDPAILGSSVRPPPPPPQYPSQGQQPGQYQPPMSSYYYPPPPQNQGRFGPSPYQAPMYGAYPPPPVQQPGMGQVPSGTPQQQQPSIPQQQQQHQQQQQPQQQQQQQQQVQPSRQTVRPPPIGPAASRQQQFQQQQTIPRGTTQVQQQQPQGVAAQDPQAQSQVPQQSAQTTIPESFAPPPVNEAPKPPTPPTQIAPTFQAPDRTPTGPKTHNVIVPALPLPGMNRAPRSPAPTPATQSNQMSNVPLTQPSAPASSNDTSSAVQDLANKVNQLAMRTGAPTIAGNSNSTTPTNANPNLGAGTYNNSRQPGMGGFVANRGNRGNRGGFNNQQPRKVEVPTTDYDFESANAKFNKQDLVKEVFASADDEKKPTSGSVTNGTNGNTEDDEKVVIPPGGDGFYNRGKSFFDNISCENKERAEAKEGERPRGGAVWRGEEQKKNLETFGQGSVDGGFGHYGRGGWRGRGRGRGFRGRTYGVGYNRGGHRGSSQQQGNTVAGGAD